MWLALALAVNQGPDRLDVYEALAHQLPIEQMKGYSAAEAKALKDGSYLEFCARANATLPNFLEKLTATNNLAERCPPGSGETLSFPKLAFVKVVAKECARRSFYAARTGNPVLAASLIVQGLKVARIVAKDAPPIDRLVANATLAIVVSSVRYLALNIPAAQAEAIQSEADAQIDKLGFGSSLRLEASRLRDQFSQFPTGDYRAFEEFKQVPKESMATAVRQAFERQQWFVDQVAVASATESPEALAKIKALADTVEKEETPANALARLHLSMVTSGLVAEIKCRTLARITWLYAAVNRYYAAHGMLPDKLADVASADRLREPFTGLEFTFEKHDPVFWIELPENPVLDGKTGLKWIKGKGGQESSLEGDVPPR